MSRPFHIHTDRLINLAKWPAAATSMLLLLPSAVTLGDIVKLFWRNHSYGLALLVGMGLFAVPLLLRRQLPSFGFWATFEHEMTHIIFALLTLHPVRSIQATDGNGGVMSHSGNGNWLILAAPYFFPTFPLLVSVIALAFPPPLRLLGVCCVGFALAWHLAATFAETHPRQTDLHKVGFPFAVVFLPGISLMSIGFVLALAHRGSGGPSWFWVKLSSNFAKAIPW